MGPENMKKMLLTVGSLLFILAVFFLLFWRPRFAELRRCQKELSAKQGELLQLERDAQDWPDSITREKLRRYEEELVELWDLIPSNEELAMLLEEIQTHARSANLEIVSMSRVSTDSRRSSRGIVVEENPRYVSVPYKISLDGSYPGLIRFLRMLEDSKRLVTVTSTKVRAIEGSRPVNAEIEFNIFYSRVGVETS